MDCSDEIEVVLSCKLPEGSGEPTVPAVIAQSTSVSTVTDIPFLPVPAVAELPYTSVAMVTDIPSLPVSTVHFVFTKSGFLVLVVTVE